MGTDSTKHELVIRFFDSELDYAEYNRWWMLYGSRAPQLKFLSENGFVVSSNGVRAAIGFVYQTDSKMCVYEFVVCNPEVSKLERSEALDMLIRAAKQWAKANGYEFIYTCANIGRYKKRLLDSGFVEGDGGQQHFLYEVK